MGLSSGIILILLGGLCLPALVAKKSPNAKDILDKVVPYQGWLGLVAFIWGVYGIFSALTSLSWLGSWPLWWTTRLIGNLMNFAGGAILGFGMIQKYLLAKAPASAQEKGKELYEKLVGMQSNIGIGCIITGLWVLLYELVLRSILKL